MNDEGGENPEQHKCRKAVMCFVIHIAKGSKLRDNFNVERSSNMIAFLSYRLHRFAVLLF